MRFTVVLSLIIFFISSFNSHAQGNDDYIRKYINQDIFMGDSNAAAAVLFEKGSIDITRGANSYTQTYTVHRILKILKEEAFEEANVREYFPAHGDIEGYVKNIKATTYNMVNGQLVKTEMDKSAVFYNDYQGGVREMKFTLPSVKVGSVIEFSYEVTTYVYMVLVPWYFQNEYPTLRSEYEINIPVIFSYVTVAQKTPEFREFNNIKDAEASNTPAYTITSKGTNFGHSNGKLWGRRNVSAMVEEPFSGNVADYMEMISVQFYSNDIPSSILDSNALRRAWKDFNSTIWEENKYSKLVKQDDKALVNIADSITKVENTATGRAKAVYSYVRNNFHCNDPVSVNVRKEIKQILEGRDGNAAELNLLLVNLLQKVGLNANPVVLGVKGGRKATHEYPLIDRFHHAVCLLQIDSIRYYLDAAGKSNAFGRLPFYCYTGYARVIERNGGYPVMIMPQYNKEKNVYKANVVELTDTSFFVNVTATLGMNTSRTLREELLKDSTIIKSHIEGKMTVVDGAKIVNVVVENTAKPDTNLIFRYTIHKRHDKQVSILYLNTDLVKLFESVPYKSMKRLMPVELDFQEEDVYMMTATLPLYMQIDDMPKSSRVNYADKIQFKHIINYDSSSRGISITSQLKRTDCFFEPAEYDAIRECYEKIYGEINQVIVLKAKR